MVEGTIGGVRQEEGPAVGLVAVAPTKGLGPAGPFLCGRRAGPSGGARTRGGMGGTGRVGGGVALLPYAGAALLVGTGGMEGADIVTRGL